jgi:hypothetical protein
MVSGSAWQIRGQLHRRTEPVVAILDWLAGVQAYPSPGSDRNSAG